MKRIAITGATGLVGSRVFELLSSKNICVPLSSNDMDILNIDSIRTRLNSTQFEYIVHFAGYTNVDNAEKEKEKAFSLNAHGTKNLLEVCLHLHKKFVYISTDFVFDGKTPPFIESSEPNPISVYGSSKYAGETVVLHNGMIVRISYPFRNSFKRKRDIVQSIIFYLQQKKRVNMITDSKIVPTFIDDIATGLNILLDNFSIDTFHLVGPQAISPYQLAQQIAQIMHLDSNLIQQTSYKTYFSGKAKRPQFSDIRSIKNSFLQMHTVEEGLHIINNQK